MQISAKLAMLRNKIAQRILLDSLRTKPPLVPIKFSSEYLHFIILKFLTSK